MSHLNFPFWTSDFLPAVTYTKDYEAKRNISLRQLGFRLKALFSDLKVQSMKLCFEKIHRKWKNIDNQILIFYFIKLTDKPEPGKKLLQGSASNLLKQGSSDVLHY